MLIEISDVGAMVTQKTGDGSDNTRSVWARYKQAPCRLLIIHFPVLRSSDNNGMLSMLWCHLTALYRLIGPIIFMLGNQRL